MTEDFLKKRAEFLARFGCAAHRFARSGFATAPLKILATREAACRACEWWDAQALKGTGRCKKCGCSTWAKLRMATERCPMGKWEAVQPPESSEATRQAPSA
jgi:predicted Zn-ribbon and HTH transcriptional regulator